MLFCQQNFFLDLTISKNYLRYIGALDHNAQSVWFSPGIKELLVQDSPTWGVTVLCPSARHFTCCRVLVYHWKTGNHP